MRGRKRQRKKNHTAFVGKPRQKQRFADAFGLDPRYVRHRLTLPVFERTLLETLGACESRLWG